MSQQDTSQSEELDKLRRALADLETRHENLIDDVNQLLTSIEDLARFARNNTEHRCREILAPEVLGAHGEEYPREYAVRMTLASIAILARRRGGPAKRMAVEFSHIAQAAISDVKHLWPQLYELHCISFHVPRQLYDERTELAPFEVTIGSTPSVLVDPEWMLAAVRYLVIYALGRTKRTPRVLRMGCCAHSPESILYITDSDEDVSPAACDRIRQPRHTYSPEFAVFRHVVRLHGGVVWKQQVGADQGAILFSLPAEQPEIASRPTQH
jgi:hypothetical protein